MYRSMQRSKCDVNETWKSTKMNRTDILPEWRSELVENSGTLRSRIVSQLYD